MVNRISRDLQSIRDPDGNIDRLRKIKWSYFLILSYPASGAIDKAEYPYQVLTSSVVYNTARKIDWIRATELSPDGGVRFHVLWCVRGAGGDLSAKIKTSWSRWHGTANVFKYDAKDRREEQLLKFKPTLVVSASLKDEIGDLIQMLSAQVIE